MDIELYKKYETYMLSQMNDSAHDCQHIYRVLYAALDIAKGEENVDTDVLISACLLHDIGRKKQFENPALCHASVGGEMAYHYLTGQGWSADKTEHVRKCIGSHRYRTDNPPDSIEAKILFDADKLDVTGAIGMARTLLYCGQTDRPLYTIDGDGSVSDGIDTTAQSFFHEYHFKLKGLYDKFYTARGRELALQRRAAAISFYESMLDETQTTHRRGKEDLEASLSSS